MARKPDILRVVANPFVHLDHEGRPAARVAEDPDFHNPDNRKVGATLRVEVIEARTPVEVAAVRGDDRRSLHDRWWDFDHTPQRLPNTPYYRSQMRACAGSAPALLPADKATAQKAGVPFRNPSDVVLETAKAMAEGFMREHGWAPDWALAGLPDLQVPEGVDATLADKLHPSHQTHVDLLAKHHALSSKKGAE